MDGVVTILVLNVCVALLFAVAFLIVRLSYPQMQSVTRFVVIYLTGTLTPISELAVRFTDGNKLFVVTSYVAFLLSVLGIPLGLSAIAARPLPWRSVTVILFGGIITRAAIWGGQRNNRNHPVVTAEFAP